MACKGAHRYLKEGKCICPNGYYETETELGCKSNPPLYIYIYKNSLKTYFIIIRMSRILFSLPPKKRKKRNRMSSMCRRYDIQRPVIKLKKSKLKNEKYSMFMSCSLLFNFKNLRMYRLYKQKMFFLFQQQRFL